MDNIPPGNNRVLTINAYNGQLLRMAGSQAIASLKAGTTTSVTVRLTDVAVMVISLDPITDLASANDVAEIEVTATSNQQLYCGISHHVDTSVSWYVEGVLGGAEVTGTISAGGFYKAPVTEGRYLVQSVSNEDPTLKDNIVIIVTALPSANTPPIANAGVDKTVLQGTSVNLTGSGSTDGDGTIASYHWGQIIGTTVTLNNADSADPFFIAPSVTSAETLTFVLTVTDDDGATASDSVSIIVQPSAGSFTVSPKIAHVLLGDSQQFSATNPNVSWNVNGTEGGNNTDGTISPAGLYSSPDAISTNPFNINIEGVDSFDATNRDFAKLAVVEETSWQKTYTLNDFYSPHNLINISPSATEGNSILFGGFGNSSIGSLRLFHLELNSEGGVVRQKQYQMPNFWEGESVSPIKTIDNGFLIAVEDRSTSTSSLNRAVDLVKLDADGNMAWAYQYATGTMASNYPCYFKNYVFEGAVAETNSNFIVGWSDYTNNECTVSFSQHLHFYVTDKSGLLTRHISMVPQYQPGADNNTAEMYIVNILPTTDGGFLAVANANIRPNIYSSHQLSAPVLIKINSDLSLAWCRQFSAPLNIINFIAGSTNEFYLIGQSGDVYTTSNFTSTILKVAANGSILAQTQLASQSGWVKIYGAVYDAPKLLLTGKWDHRTYNYTSWDTGATILINADANFTEIQWQQSYGDGILSTASAGNGYYSVSGTLGVLEVLRVPSDTGLIAGVSKNFPANPDIILSGSAITLSDIGASNYFVADPTGSESSPLTLTEISLPPELTVDTRSGLLSTIAIARKPDSGRLSSYGSQMQFHASLSHLVTNSTVTWSVNGIAGGNAAVGVIDLDGTYTSPDSVPDPDTVIIRATSVEEPSLSAEITLTIQPGGS